MVRHLFASEIAAVDLALEREQVAAITMKRLLDHFGEEDTPLAIAVALTRRGVDRILRVEDALFFRWLIDQAGADEAWSIACRVGMFRHMDLITLPGFTFNLNNMSDKDCIDRFRFDHFGIQQLCLLLRIPEVIIVPGHRDRVCHVEAVCLMLDRMAYPRKWNDLSQRYNRHKSALSRIFKYLIHTIITGARSIIIAAKTTTPERLENYARAFWRRGVPQMLKVWSLIDVKKVVIARPGRPDRQRAQYSGHSKKHCFKFQTLQAPDGLILHCSYCNDGRRGDAYILSVSGLIEWARSVEILAGYYIFGDSAFLNNDVMLSMFRGRNLPAAALAFNKVMARIRTGVGGVTCTLSSISR